jgi:hypothetical protein
LSHKELDFHLKKKKNKERAVIFLPQPITAQNRGGAMLFSCVNFLALDPWWKWTTLL